MQVEGVILLRLDEPATHFDRVEFIGADAPEQDLVVSGLGVEIPFTSNPDERYGQGPAFQADLQRRPAGIGRIHDKRVPLLRERRKREGIGLVTNGVFGAHEVLAVWTEHRGDRRFVEGCRRLNERVGRRLCSRECPGAAWRHGCSGRLGGRLRC